jgi:hypothetical protein
MLVPCGDEPLGITMVFTRDGPDGKPLRYSVYAYPQLDGRLQTLVWSHTGKASWAPLTGDPWELATMRPETGGLFSREDLGVELALPPGWRQGSFIPGCGNDNPRTEEELRREFMPVAVFTIVDPAAKMPGYECQPRVELHMIRDLNRSLGSVLGSLGDAEVNAAEFVFADGNAGRISESANFFTIVRRDGRRFAKLGVTKPRAEDRDKVLTLARGLRLVKPAFPEARSEKPKDFSLRNVSMTYPGDWTVGPGYMTARMRQSMLEADFEPIDKPTDPAAKRAGQFSPELRLSFWRVDDIPTKDSVINTHSALPNGATEDVSTELQPFKTDSGWVGWRWIRTSIIQSPRGRSVFHAIYFGLPMPDGATILLLDGQTSTNKLNEGSAEKVEEIWARIAASARPNLAARNVKASGAVEAVQ